VMCNRNASRKEEVASTGFLSWETLGRVKPAFAWAERVCFSGFGEPLLHPSYSEMARFIKSFGTHVYLFTNGVALTAEKARALIDAQVDLICVSFGAARADTYRYIRGVEMNLVVENLKGLAEAKKQAGKTKPEVHFNVVAMNSVLPELVEMVRIASRLGVKQIMMPHLCPQKPELESESPWVAPRAAEKYFEEARREAEALGVVFSPPDLNQFTRPCHEFFMSLFVTWDGRVLSCPLERFQLGGVDTASVRQLWNGRGIRGLRGRVVREGIQTVCPNCFCWDHRAEAFLHPHENSRVFATRLDR